jgi:hypothetical protein
MKGDGRDLFLRAVRGRAAETGAIWDLQLRRFVVVPR